MIRSLLLAAMFLIPLRAMALQIGDQSSELVISQVSPRTVCIEFAPLNGRERLPTSTVLVNPRPSEKLRVCDIVDQQMECGDPQELAATLEFNGQKIELGL